MFITSREDFKEYLSSVKRPFMKTFYEKQRKKHEILTVANKPVGGKWSYDEENRKKIPKGVIPPPVQTNKNVENKNYQDCLKLINELFSDHPGDVDDFLYPINIKDAGKFFKDFLKNRFSLWRL